MTSYEILHNPNPKINELEHLLKNDPRVNQNLNYKKALELKLQSLIQEPSIIEKTMTEEQLYHANNPLWARDLTAEEADAVLKHTVGTCKLTEEEFNDRYQKALDGELTKKPFHLVMGW